jgi:hypothetical protein
MGDKGDFEAVNKAVKNLTILAFILGVLHVLGQLFLSPALSKVIPFNHRPDATLEQTFAAGHTELSRVSDGYPGSLLRPWKVGFRRP